MSENKTGDIVATYIEELAREVDTARASEKFQAYLAFCARFHTYSMGNVISILVHCPTATRVAGFNAWKRLGRHVRRGEKGIPITVPLSRRRADRAVEDADADADAVADARERERQARREGGEALRFGVRYVFDVSQTEGAPLPEPPEWRSPAQQDVLRARLTAFAEARGIRVRTAGPGELPGDAQGVSMGGLIVLRPGAGVKTLIHELAHELMHQRGDVPGGLISRAAREQQAEAVAWVVARHFGVEGLQCANYVALHGGDAQQIRAACEAISACAREIIRGVEEAGEQPDQPAEVEREAAGLAA